MPSKAISHELFQCEHLVVARQSSFVIIQELFVGDNSDMVYVNIGLNVANQASIRATASRSDLLQDGTFRYPKQQT